MNHFEVDTSQIINYYKSGRSINNTSETFGLTYFKVKTILVSAGLKLRKAYTTRREKFGGEKWEEDKSRDIENLMLTEKDIEEDLKTRLYK